MSLPPRISAFVLLCILVSASSAPSAQAAVAVRVADLASGAPLPGDAYPQDFYPLGTRLLFSASDRNSSQVNPERRLWVTDGTANGTEPLVEGVTVQQVVGRLNGAYLWIGAQGSEPARLWRTDSTTGASRPLSPAALDAQTFPSTLLGAGLGYFLARERSTNRFSWWRTDGSVAGTIQLASLDSSMFPGAQSRAGRRVLLELTRFSQTEPPTRSLLSSDGTPEGTLEILSTQTLFPSSPRSTETLAFFTLTQIAANQPAELWRTDGTRAGTRRVAHFAHPSAFVATDLVAAGRRIFFLALDAANRLTLWSSDGSVAGTSAASAPGAFTPDDTGLDADRAKALGGLLLFSANDGASGLELWRSDGTRAGTRRVLDACPGSCGALRGPLDASALTRIGSRLLYRANDGSTGEELWESDGTPTGTRRLVDLCPGTCSGLRSDPVEVDGQAFFVARSSEAPAQLWTSDGTPVGTRQISGLAQDQDDPTLLASLEARSALRTGGRYWFAGKGATGFQLYTTSGSPATARLAVQLGEPLPPGSAPQALTPFREGLLFFATASPEAGTRPYFLPPESSTPVDLAGRRLSLPVQPPPTFAVIGDLAFFVAGGELGVTDGTPEGTRQLTAFTGLEGSRSVSSRTVRLGDRAYFAVQLSDPSGPERAELWASDGTPIGTGPAVAPPEIRRVLDLTSDGERLVFAALVGGGSEVWASDGTALGTLPITNGLENTSGGRRVGPAYAQAGRTYFYLTEIGPNPRFPTTRISVWSTDGTPDGTRLEVAPALLAQSIDHAGFVELDQSALLVADVAGTIHHGLYRIGDAGDVELVAGLSGERALGPPVRLGSQVFLSTRRIDPTAAEGSLWQSDGTPAGTRPSFALPPAPSGLYSDGSGLYYSGFASGTGVELWTVGGFRPAGPVLRQDLQPGARSSEPADFVRVDGVTYFTADDGATGRELWRLDTRPGAPACPPSPSALCLNRERFRVEVVWQDFSFRQGLAQAAPLTADTGAFWFFDDANLEAAVKVLDGTSVNERFWVFYGALTNVRYQLLVTDTTTGAARSYTNRLGQLRSIADTAAFTRSGQAGGPAVVELSAAPPTAPSLETHATETQGPCVAEPGALCLLEGRFRVALVLDDPHLPTLAGQAAPWSVDAGFFWLFAADNLEVAVKMVDGRALNDRFWLFSASLSNLGYRLEVTDLVTGTSRTYRNAPGQLASFADTAAF